MEALRASLESTSKRKPAAAKPEPAEVTEFGPRKGPRRVEKSEKGETAKTRKTSSKR